MILYSTANLLRTSRAGHTVTLHNQMMDVCVPEGKAAVLAAAAAAVAAAAQPGA